MAVDKGSLNYKIRVKDEFSKPIQKFRRELLKARNTAAFVKQELGRTTVAISKLGVASKKASTQTKQLTDEEKAHWKAVREGAKTAATAERLRARARKDQIKENTRIQKGAQKVQKDAAAEALQQAKEREKASKAAAAASIRASNARRRASAAAAKTAAQARRQQALLNRQLTTTGKKANGLVLTFKRLAGVFVGFQAIRFVSQALASGITAGIQFNRVVEDTRIGLAGMFSTLQQVRDIQTGEILTGAEGFAASLQIADATLEKIRQRSLATSATFTELATAFRAGAAPGFSAGLNVDQIIEVTERVSQVLTGLGIAQNQINEEIRSLLLGTATSRTSLVATLFFGGASNSNRIIKEARKVKNGVFDVITDNLGAFKIAAIEAQKSFTGITSRIKGLLQFTAGAASLSFFAELKGALLDIQDVFSTVDRESDGFIKGISPRPEVIAILQQAFNTMTRLTAAVREFAAGLSAAEISAVLATIGASVEVFAAVLLGLLDGAIRGVAILGSAFSVLGFAVSDLDLENLTRVASVVGTILTIVLAVKTAMLSWVVLTKVFTKGMALAAAIQRVLRVAILANLGAIQLMSTAFSKTIPVVKRLTIAVAGIGLGVKGVIAIFTGLSLTVGETASVIFITFEDLFNRIRLTGKLAVELLANAWIFTINKLIQGLAFALSSIFGPALSEVAAQLARVGAITEKQRIGIQGVVDTVERLRSGGDAITLFDTDETISDINKQLEETQTKFDALTKAAQARAQAEKDAAFNLKQSGAEVETIFGTITGSIGDTFSGLFDGLLDGSILDPIESLFDGLIDGSIFNDEDITAKGEEIAEKTRAALQPKPEDIETPYADAFRKAFKTAGDEYANTVAIMKGITSTFSSFLSSEVSEAMDPNEDPEGPSANERFKAFLDQVGKLIIQKLIELAIAKSILSIAGGAAGGGQAAGAAHGGQIGFDDGGPVPGGKHEAKAFRPASVAVSDTVPAWLTPGEFVTPVRQVLKYGADLLEGMRTGAIDPAALREAAGLTNRRKSVKKVRARGFAEGGPIGNLASQGAASIQQQENTTARSDAGSPTPALMVSGDQQMDRWMAGGQRSFRNWAENDKEFFRGIVNE